MSALPSLEKLLADNDVTTDVIELLKGEPFKFKTVKHLANYFEDKAEIKVLFLDAKSLMDGDVRADVIQAWREAESLVCRGLKRREADLPDEAWDDPLRQEVVDGLDETFSKKYDVILPAAWMAPPAYKVASIASSRRVNMFSSRSARSKPWKVVQPLVHPTSGSVWDLVHTSCP